MKREKKIRIVLHNIRSVYNVGSIFRTADGAGVEKIYLVGVTPAPIDRFGRKRADFGKVALGAEESVAWEKVENIQQTINGLVNEGYRVIAVEQHSHSMSFADFKPGEMVAYIFGSETEGLPEEVLEMSDAIVEIPMFGKKESLNVSVAAGIILFSSL